MTGKRKKGVNESDIINSAIQEGISEIIEHHPKFKENQEYIARHIDNKRLNKKVGEIYKNIEKNQEQLSHEERITYLYKELTNYVASGSAFDDLGKEVILKKGLEEKAKSGFFRGFGARRELKGEKYLDNVVESFQDLYALFKKGDYAQRMPELAKAVTTVYDMNFLDPAVDILKHYGLIDKQKYNLMKKSIRQKTTKEAGNIVGGIEKYLTPQKVAVSILGIFGVGLLISSGMNITGGVIGNLSSGTTGLIGGFLFLISLALFFKGSKRK
ncbi:MAG: hypothetical protein QF567_03040 [Candidatus Pacearchaeota archaeon]|jgi:hypothetical protein|nr:hypothetical protein [Candidatus Pacearchaeota archaeon]|tara:strand:- start:1687 stop:2499 length:813 start_codon:yes stop_codon:yes gene_type:complete